MDERVFEKCFHLQGSSWNSLWNWSLRNDVVDFNLKTKLYTLQWEEENEDTEKENNYTGRKIGMYLHSDELEKFEIGECIRKKFEGLVYDGEIVSVNLETKLYHIKYSDGDTEDMTVSDIRKFWIAKEVDKKKRGSKNDEQQSNKNEWLRAKL